MIILFILILKNAFNYFNKNITLDKIYTISNQNKNKNIDISYNHMNDKILNLDNKIKLKKTVENNIIYVIKNYAQNMDHVKSPFISYTKEYIMSILYNNVKIL